MDKMTRQGIHDLLDRVLNVQDGKWGSLYFMRTSSGIVKVKLSVSNVSYEEERPWSEVNEVVTRAKEATNE